jgi:Putative addiction module component
LYSLAFVAQNLELTAPTDYYSVMPMTLDQITEEAIKLPAASRALLADKLVQSLESEEPDEIQRLLAAEAIRPRDEIRAGKVQPLPGEQVLEEVRHLVRR